MKEDLLLIATSLVVFVIMLQLIRGFILSRGFWRSHKPQNLPDLKIYLEKASDNPRGVLKELDKEAIQHDADIRSNYYCIAGEIALTILRRPAIAIRYYSKAVRMYPQCNSAFDRLVEILIAQKRYKRLEITCWSLLARLSEEDVGSAIWKQGWSGLITVYSRNQRQLAQADAIRKMLKAVDDSDELGPFTSDDKNDEPSSTNCTPITG